VSSIPGVRPPQGEDVLVVYPHQGFMVVLGTACLLIGAACLIAAVVILPSDPAGTGGATGIGSFFCLAGWYVLAARRCPQMTVSERGVRLHRDSPLRRALKLNRVTELAWADIRRVGREARAGVEPDLHMGDHDLLLARRRAPEAGYPLLHGHFHVATAHPDEAVRGDRQTSDRVARGRITLR